MGCKIESQLLRTLKVGADFLWREDKLGKEGIDFVEAWILTSWIPKLGAKS